MASLAPVLLLHGMIVAGRPGASPGRRGATAEAGEEAPGLLITQ
jgi:hypothetical protein